MTSSHAGRSAGGAVPGRVYGDDDVPARVRLSFGDDHVASVLLDRPPHNFIEEADVAALVKAVTDAADGGARCILLSTSGKNFCAGASLQSKLGGGVDFGMYEHIPQLFGSIPMVAAVRGRAVGAGLGLALVADHRVVSARTRFVAPFTRLGFHHGFGLSVTLPRVVGLQRTAELLIAGTEVDGARAYEIGLADRLVDDGEVLAAARAFAVDIATAAPLAVRAARASLRGDLAADVRKALADEQQVQEHLMRTSDFVEGVAAATERRSPEFHGK